MKNILSSLTKSEKNRILEMHKKSISRQYLTENPTGNTSNLSNIVSSQNDSIDAANITRRFGDEKFKTIKGVADQNGMTQINNLREDNSFYQWSKDLGGGNKLMLFLYNPTADRPDMAVVATYVDRDNGAAYTISNGKFKKGSGLKMGSYPSLDSIYNTGVDSVDSADLTAEINKISGMFKTN